MLTSKGIKWLKVYFLKKNIYKQFTSYEKL